MLVNNANGLSILLDKRQVLARLFVLAKARRQQTRSRALTTARALRNVQNDFGQG